MTPAAPPPRRARRRPSYDVRVAALVLAGGLPAVLTVFLLLVLGDYSTRVVWTLGGLVVFVWIVAAVAVRTRVVRPLQTLANLLAALREPLRAQRLGAVEAVALLQRVMAEVDVAMFAVDSTGVVRLVNRAGERLLGRPSGELLGQSASDVGLGEMTASPAIGARARRSW